MCDMKLNDIKKCISTSQKAYSHDTSTNVMPSSIIQCMVCHRDAWFRLKGAYSHDVMYDMYTRKWGMKDANNLPFVSWHRGLTLKVLRQSTCAKDQSY